MRYLLFIILFWSGSVTAQHCPWDCSGLILLEPGIARDRASKLDLVLVDKDFHVIADTIFGSGTDNHPVSRFYYYDDFLADRIKRTGNQRWYRYDTVYHFAAGTYLARYNFCRYDNEKLFLRYTDPVSREDIFRYIPVPDSNRVHLHDYHALLNALDTAQMKKETAPFVWHIPCRGWGFSRQDCPDQ